jgi:predicted transcriptional regulator
LSEHSERSGKEFGIKPRSSNESSWSQVLGDKILQELPEELAAASGPVLAAVITRRCNLCNDTFHFFSDELVRQGFLSKSINNEQIFYGTTRVGLDFLRRFNELQVSAAPLERSLGKLLV